MLTDGALNVQAFIFISAGGTLIADVKNCRVGLSFVCSPHNAQFLYTYECIHAVLRDFMPDSRMNESL